MTTDDSSSNQLTLQLSYLNSSSAILIAPLGHFPTCSIIVCVSALFISIQGFLLGSNTGANPLKQMVEWMQTAGFQSTVISPLVYLSVDMGIKWL